MASHCFEYPAGFATAWRTRDQPCLAHSLNNDNRPTRISKYENDNHFHYVTLIFSSFIPFISLVGTKLEQKHGVFKEPCLHYVLTLNWPVGNISYSKGFGREWTV